MLPTYNSLCVQFHFSTPPLKRKTTPEMQRGTEEGGPERRGDFREATWCQQRGQDSNPWLLTWAWRGPSSLHYRWDVVGTPVLERAELGTNPERERKAFLPWYTSSVHPIPQLCPRLVCQLFPTSTPALGLGRCSRVLSRAQSCQERTSRRGRLETQSQDGAAGRPGQDMPGGTTPGLAVSRRVGFGGFLWPSLCFLLPLCMTRIVHIV